MCKKRDGDPNNADKALRRVELSGEFHSNRLGMRHEITRIILLKACWLGNARSNMRRHGLQIG